MYVCRSQSPEEAIDHAGHKARSKRRRGAQQEVQSNEELAYKEATLLYFLKHGSAVNDRMPEESALSEQRRKLCDEQAGLSPCGWCFACNGESGSLECKRASNVLGARQGRQSCQWAVRADDLIGSRFQVRMGMNIACTNPYENCQYQTRPPACR